MGAPRSLNPTHDSVVENVSCDGNTITFTDPTTGQHFTTSGRFKQMNISIADVKTGILVGAIELFRTRIMAPFEIDFTDINGRFRYLPSVLPDNHRLLRVNQSIAVFETPWGEEAMARADGCAWDETHSVFCGFIGEELFVFLPCNPY